MIRAVTKNERARVGRPGRVVARSDDLRIASLRADNTDLEPTRERGKGEPFAVGRPIRLGGVGGEVGWDAPGRAARSGDGEQAGGAALARNVANGLSVGRP